MDSVKQLTVLHVPMMRLFVRVVNQVFKLIVKINVKVSHVQFRTVESVRTTKIMNVLNANQDIN